VTAVDETLGSELSRAVREAFEADQVPLLARLVDHPGASHEPDRVELAMRVLDAEAESLGLAAERHPDPEGRFADHRVYAKEKTGARDAALLLVGHMDTVFPRTLGDRGFSRDGDVVRGPGVLDMKAGLAEIVCALRAVKRVSTEAWAALSARVLVVSDEEVGSTSSRDLTERLARASSRALVFEHGRGADRIVTRRKGTGTFRVVARGRAAHAGLHHEDGVSAIHALALVIDELERITDPSRGIIVNVGLVEGGTAKNTVPAHASCVVDVRYETAEHGARIVEAFERVVREPLPGRLSAAHLELTGGLARPPMEPSIGSDALRRDYERHAAAVGLGTGEAPRQGGGSDANFIAAQGTPCIDGLGPAGAHAHHEDEWASLDSLRKRTEALARFLAEHALHGER
jgi:glutamate carboxypeptidase